MDKKVRISNLSPRVIELIKKTQKDNKMIRYINQAPPNRTNLSRLMQLHQGDAVVGEGVGNQSYNGVASDGWGLQKDKLENLGGVHCYPYQPNYTENSRVEPEPIKFCNLFCFIACKPKAKLVSHNIHSL